MFLKLKTLINFVNDGTNVGVIPKCLDSAKCLASAKCLVSAKMFNVYFYVYPMRIEMRLVLKMYSHLY